MSAQAVAHLPPTPPHEPAKLSRMATSSSTASKPQHKHIWVITGPAGCGKTSVAEHLHSSFQFPYLEGDTFHTAENVKKMREGTPLTDADRWDWLILLREEALKTLAASSDLEGVVVTCSALKRKYRDVFRLATYHNPDVLVHFVFLNASESLLMDRVRARQNHYMKDYMVRSQFESLEAPQKDETDVLSVEASGTSVEVQELALAVVNKVVDSDAGIA
ncbi:shikimate kinase [Hortaea werneckii]|nr:shikimate kinase [Hortaea werneckii]KAI7608001.1 shikimate kinase [Hortaea werneckii]KAI7639046.1 shikimate kinase [Hortaea werneckii]